MNLSTAIFATLILLTALYCQIDPFHHSAISSFPNFVAHKVNMPPWSQLPFVKDTTNLLKKSDVMFLNQVQGPESVAFDPLGRGPYAGVADGRVVFWNGDSWTEFAYTSLNRSAELCKWNANPMSYLKNEHICGRPLGIRFHKKTGDLYIADAYFGLLKVGPDGGLATVLTKEAEGVPLKFTNDLDVDDEGNVYFTDSSTNYQRRNFIQLVLSAENTGRVLKYDHVTKQTIVLERELQFPNGLTLSKDGSFFIFCEGAIGRLRRYWLKGDKAGTSEIFAILPGFPDNIRTNKDGDFWVALHCRRNLYAHVISMYPSLRKFILKLPISAKYQFQLHIGGKPHAIILKYSPEGKVIQVLEDSDGEVIRSVSEVEEKDGKLWIGSVLMPFIGVYTL